MCRTELAADRCYLNPSVAVATNDGEFRQTNGADQIANGASRLVRFARLLET